jgi:hypothetical protein
MVKLQGTTTVLLDIGKCCSYSLPVADEVKHIAISCPHPHDQSLKAKSNIPKTC